MFGAERMETEQSLLSIRNINRMKEFVNAYHQSIGHHGPYEIESTCKLSLPVKVSCRFVHGKIWNHEDKCLYICDTAAFKRLEAALNEVSLVDKGAAWPYVNWASGQPTVDWIMLQNDMQTASDYSWTPSAKVWFILSDATKNLLDHVACLLGLVPFRTTITLNDMQGSVSTLAAVQLQLSVTMIVIHPEDLIASVCLSPGPQCCSVCISEKGPFRTFSHRAGLVKAECENFIITEVPTFLKRAIVQAKESTARLSSADSKEFLHSEITIKEESISDTDTFSCYNDISESVVRVGRTSTKDEAWGTDTDNVSNEGRDWIAHYQESGGVAEQLSLTVQHLEQVLQCPKCPAVFKSGLHGKGLGHLLCHVYKCHQRLISHCRSVIKAQYAALIQDYNKYGKGCVFQSSIKSRK